MQNINIIRNHSYSRSTPLERMTKRYGKKPTGRMNLSISKYGHIIADDLPFIESHWVYAHRHQTPIK